MGKKEKLLTKAIASPANLGFGELCSLAESVGFEFARTKGSHHLYKHDELVHPTHGKRMNFQPDKNNPSKAKVYQVKQLLEFIEHFQLLGGIT